MVFWIIGSGICVGADLLICKYMNFQNLYVKFGITVLITMSIYGVAVLPVILRVFKSRNLYKN